MSLLLSSLALLVIGLCVGLAVMWRRARRQVSPASEPKPPVKAPAGPSRVEARAAPAAAVVGAGHVPAGDQSGPVARFLVQAVGLTHPGKHRAHNEDAFDILDDAHVFVVADGMGRHAAGEVASRICVETVREVFRGNGAVPPSDPPLPWREARIRHAIVTANTRVREAAEANDAYRGMGTTVVSACFSPNSQRAFIAHVGDSRCYRLRGDEIVQLTADHTMGAAGFKGPNAGLLARAVGVEEEVDVDVDVQIPEPDDVYLLCSDGLTRMVPDDRILAAVKKGRNDLAAAVNELISLANEQGGRDNITAILVRVDEAPLT
jgi:serine/threonine protein phosphatase PrpC